MGVAHTDAAKLDGKSAKAAAEKISERIQKLRSDFLNITPQISSERVRYYTEAYKEFQAEPIIIKRAKALNKMLTNMAIYIMEGELIVGNTCKYPRGVELFPEFEVEWIEREIEDDPFPFEERPSDRFIMDDETKNELRRFISYQHPRFASQRITL